MLACGVLLPLINQLSDPDYINQFVIWMVRTGTRHRRSCTKGTLQIRKRVCFPLQIRDSSCNYEAFMNILKLTDKPAELEAVKDKVVEELQYLRSLDTAGDGGRSLCSAQNESEPGDSSAGVELCFPLLPCCLCLSVL